MTGSLFAAALAAASLATPLPPGAPQDPWSLGDAERIETSTRARWCLNGLWGLRPPLEGDAARTVPARDGTWGWGKIPSVWEPKGSWGRKGQFVYLPRALRDKGIPANIDDRAWYVRDFTMPSETAGRKTVVSFTMLQTRAEVYVDGAFAAEVAFPGGEADITKFARPGEKQSLALYVTAFPLDAETLTFNAPDRATKSKAQVDYRGVTGDVYLDAYPPGPSVASATVECDTAAKTALFRAEIAGAKKGDRFRLEARVAGAETSADRAVRDFASAELAAGESGEISFKAAWPDAALWDVHTPGNTYSCALTLKDARGRVLDRALPFRFGFRDVKISGRELLLNGIPVHLRGQVARNMKAPAGAACRKTVEEACRRMRETGVNFLICDNYNFSPGGVSYFDAFLDVCDEKGMLVSFSLPHARDFGMNLGDPATDARYEALAKWVVGRVRNHPCVISYAMNHNAAGYTGDMNPLKIDGKHDLEHEKGNGHVESLIAKRDMLRVARAIAGKLDPTRPAYHHESGNLDDFHTVNIYLDWAPRQERSDWLEHWSREGVKPLFFVEWGMPHYASWSSYRGPQFIHRARVRQSMWANEFAAAILGDAPYGDSPEYVSILGNEERLWTRREPPAFYEVSWPLRPDETRCAGVQAYFMSDNWRSHRAWGITAMLPWDQDAQVRRAGKEKSVENPDRWKDLKRTGIVPDVICDVDWFTGAGDAASYAPTSVGKSMMRWNMDDCAFIGGEGVFTDKTHHYRPGDTARKTLVVLNDRRVAQKVRWSVALEASGKVLATKKGAVSVAPGTRADVPVEFALPGTPGKFALKAEFEFAGGVRQTDVFTLESYAPATTPETEGLLLYDTKGLTAANFDRLGIKYGKTDCKSPLPPEAVLAVGRESLTRELLDGVLVPFALRQGKVLVFEQKKSALQAAGFRAQTYGLRKTFPRTYEASKILCLDEDMLRDWNGESTIEPPYLENLPRNEVSYNKDTWACFRNTRVWRCRNRGCVATAIPEKPTVGDWRAHADGGFDLQYAPLLDWTIEAGRITFCQLDVTARTVADPVADDIVKALVARLCKRRQLWPKRPRGYGARAEALVRDFQTNPKPDSGDGERGLYNIYVASPGGKPPKDFAGKIADGGRALLLGLSKEELAGWMPVPFEMAPTNGCYAGRIERPDRLLDGLSNADWTWHGSMAFDAFQGASKDGNAALRTFKHGKGYIIVWQTPPWTFDVEARPYLRTTRRRADWTLWRILGNLECNSGATSVMYADIPVPDDDPYRYYRW